MVRISGQTGVPVIVIDGQFVVGFDRGRLQALLAQARRAESRPPRVPLGLSVADAKPGPDRPGGAYVGSVRPGSPADRAGLRAGDVIVEVSGAPVRGAADLERVMAAFSPSQEVPVTALRAGQALHFRVLLE